MNIVLVGVVCSVVVGLHLMLSRRYVLREMASVKAQFSEQQKSIEILSDQHRALVQGAVGLTEHLARLEANVKRLGLRQDQLDLRDPVNQSYDHAIKLIRNGASLHELMNSCGLVRDEAELLLQMYRVQFDKAS